MSRHDVPAFAPVLFAGAVGSPSWSVPVIELALAVGVLLTVGGLVLQMRMARQRMSAEEGMKDGRLTEAQAVWRIRLYALGGPTLTLLGAALLVAGLMRHLE